MALPSIENNPSIIHCRDVRDICNPLFKNTDINYFCYCRIYTDKSYFALSSNPEWVKHFYYTQHSSAGYQGNALQPGMYFSHNIERMGCTQEMIKDMQLNFKLYDIFVFLDLNTEFCDMMIYCMKKVTYDATNFYLTNLSLLNNYNNYFMEKANELIISADENRICVPDKFSNTFSLKKNSINCSSISPSSILKLKNNFKTAKLQSCNKLYSKMHLHLTNKEIECLDLIMHGKTSKMIGKILNISYRTVETHMENIKKKLNIQSKSELIDFIFDQVIYS